MNSIINLIRPELRHFIAYSSARDEAKEGIVWLNANESPFDYKIQDDVVMNRYPKKQPAQLLQKLADIFKVKASQLVLSRGSDEVIDLLTRLFCRAEKDSIMICPPTFGMYSVCAKLQGADIVEVPLEKEVAYQLNLSAIARSWNSTIKIIFLCSPNNPTGNSLSTEDILSLCETYANKSIVVVDEAYIEYSDAESLSRYINQYPNLVILRTFSKAYGLAGARCGFLLAQEELVNWILKIIAPYPLPSMISKVVSDIISPNGLTRIQHQIDCIKSERTRLVDAIKMLPCIKKVWQSDANFLLVEVSNANKIMTECMKKGIVLRSMQSKPGLENCVRISIGLPEENTRVINLLQKVVE